MEFNLSKNILCITKSTLQRIVHCNCSSKKKIFSKLITRLDETTPISIPATIEQIFEQASSKIEIVWNDRKQRMLVPHALIESLFRHGQVDDSFCLHASPPSGKARKVSGWVEKDDGRFQDNYQSRPSSSELGSRSKRVSKWRAKRESFVDTAKCIPLLERGGGGGQVRAVYLSGRRYVLHFATS